MATTTNYSWVTPDDTSLVKDGASAIRTLGSSIDTTVFNNASASIAKTIVDAKGDIIAATAADTVSRLAVGANDTVLIADSSTATGLKWGTPGGGGGMTLLSTTTLSGTSTTVSSISGSYKSLIGYIYGINLASADAVEIQPNGVSNTAYSATMGITQDSSTGGQWFLGTQNANWLSGNLNNAFTFRIDNYANAIRYKPVSWSGIFYSSGPTARPVIGGGAFLSNTAITSLVITSASPVTLNAGTLLLYGVN